MRLRSISSRYTATDPQYKRRDPQHISLIHSRLVDHLLGTAAFEPEFWRNLEVVSSSNSLEPIKRCQLGCVIQCIQRNVSELRDEISHFLFQFPSHPPFTLSFHIYPMSTFSNDKHNALSQPTELSEGHFRQCLMLCDNLRLNDIFVHRDSPQLSVRNYSTTIRKAVSPVFVICGPQNDRKLFELRDKHVLRAAKISCSVKLTCLSCYQC